MATFIKGDVIILSVYDVAGTAYQPVACLTSNSISSTLSSIDTVTKCDPGLTIKSPGVFDYSDLNLDAPTGGEYSTFTGTLNGSGNVLLVDPIT